MTYMPIMMALTVLIFIVIFIFVDTPTLLLRSIVGIVAIILAGVLFKYNYDKSSIRKQVKAIKNNQEYDDAVMLGHCFLVEDRMLTYRKGKCHEYVYNDVSKLTLLKGKKDKVVMEVKDTSYTLPLASLGQGDRLATFIQRKNPSVILEGLNANSGGLLHDIDKSQSK